MNKFNINIDGNDYTDLNEDNSLDNFKTFGEVEDFESDDLNEDLNDISSPISAEKQCIEIEIVGLKSLNSFIGLDDTPIYYDNGRFFKVEDNKVVYTDIEWSDIKGNISDNPSAVEEIEKQVYKSTSSIISNNIRAHNSDVDAHPYLQNIISENHENLNNKIDLNKYNTDEDIRNVSKRIDLNDGKIKKLEDDTSVIRSDLDDLIVEVQADIKTSIIELDEKVDGININLTKQIDDLQQDVNDKYDDLVEDIDDLSEIVDGNYNTLDSKIDTTSQNINQRITEVAEEINQTIEDNVVALQQEDTALQNQINTHSQQITQEISDRQTSDSNLQTQITTNTTDISELTQVVQDDYDELKGLIEQEIEDREGADDNLQDQINNLKARGRFLALWDATTGLAMSNPKTEKYQFITGDYFIVGKVGETNYRPTGTEYVIGRASTEVEPEELTVDDVYYFDGEHWRLQVNHGKTVSFANLAGEPSDNTNLKNALDSKQPVGDYATNTRVNEVENKIPSLEGYATKTYVNNHHDNTKQDVINDLEQIRVNAQTGARLKTQVETNTSDISDLKTNKANKTELPTKLSELEDDITDSLGSELDYTGTTLSLLNGQSDVLSSVTIKSTPDLDETTINLNNDDKLQSVGSILQSGGYQKYWEGTKSEFNAITNKDHNTLYQVLDDEESALFEVDGTSIEFSDDNILQIPQNVDYVIQEQTWGDGESGYRMYRRGRLEQWGIATTSSTGETEFTMHTNFRDLNFSVFIEPREQGDFFHYAIPSGNRKFRCRVKGSNGSIIGIKVQWRAYGYYK